MKVRIDGSLKCSPTGEHFSKAGTSSQDKLAGDLMAQEIGDIYLDWGEQNPNEQWTQVMKALRVHGFDISFDM